MFDSITNLSATDLRELVSALESGRLAAPFSELSLKRFLASDAAQATAHALHELHSQGFSVDQIATTLSLLVSDRKKASKEPPIDLVTSGPEAPGIANRDTSVVVREMFRCAQESVLVVGYAVYQGDQVFEALATRMEEQSKLDVQMFLDIARTQGDNTRSEILVSRYAQRFRSSQWPADHRLPSVYYDPRSVDDKNPVRSSLHAKCIVVDGRHVFISSANFTDAGQNRNVEVGIKIESPWLAERIVRHFQRLREADVMWKAF